MNQEIYCAVNNCHYWKSGNHCDAEKIVVVSDSFGASAPDAIDAPKAATIQPTPAGTCMETCCKTFVEKGSTQIDIDGVKRM